MACRCGCARLEVDGMEIKMALYLPRDAASVPVSRRVLDRCLETLGVTPDTRADIALALSEACANVIQHAGPGQEYEVQASAKNGRCAIEVADTGSRDGKPRAGRQRDRRRTGRPVCPGRRLCSRDRRAWPAGLMIIDAVADHLQLTGSASGGRPFTSIRLSSGCPERPGGSFSAPV